MIEKTILFLLGILTLDLLGYEEFGKYLDDIGEDSISISFGEIEEIIGQKLPNSAYQYDEWWSNSDSHPLMKVVLSKNWKKRKTNLSLKEIKFYKSSELSLLKFLKEDKMVMFRNYQPIVIKMLLEAKNTSSKSEPAVTVKEIREEIAKLSFGTDSDSSISSVSGTLAKRGLVDFTGTSENDTATLKEGVVNTDEIQECLKICGQKIAKWHIDEIVKGDYHVWRMPPGSVPENHPYEREFLESNTIGIGWGRIGDDVIEKNMTKEQTEELFRENYPPTPEKANSPQAFTNFTHEMKPKDIVVLLKKKTIVDFAIVVGPYRYQKDPSIDIPDNAKSYSHRCDVVWLNRGTISESEAFEFSRTSTCDRVSNAQLKEQYINLLLEEESESRDYWAVKTGTKDASTWEMMLSSKKILCEGLDIDLSEFYDQNGNYKHELGNREKVSQELKDEIKKNDPEANKEAISWHAISFKKFMSVKKNDIVVVWSGTKDRGFKIHGYGKVLSEYIFYKNTPDPFHQKSVEWINTNEMSLPEELEKIGSSGASPAAKFMNFHELPDSWKKWLFGKTQQNYYVITQNPDSPSANSYEDIEGEQYGYDSDKAHYKNFKEGTKFVVQSKIDGKYYFIGYGEVGQLEKTQKTKENGRSITKINAKFSNYTKFVEKKIRTEDINQKLLRIAFPKTGGNPQPPAMLQISKKIYEEITGDRSTMSTTTERDDSVDSRTMQILERKKNIILHGPPGTGKTWNAKKIAKKLTENQTSETQKIWLWPVTPENWKVAVQKKTWGSGDEINKLKQIISKNDLVVFYVNTTNEIQGIFKFSGDWYQAKENIWHGDRDAGNNIDIDEICQGHLDIRSLHDILDLFEGAESINAINARLQSKGKIRRGPASELTRRDFNIISERMGIDVENQFTRIVTFHQSYGYEEFIEGIRPKSTNNIITYPIEHGIFRKICDAARVWNGKFVLIIDEINRGNISKIFGELITTIENDKRGDVITLAYSGDPFYVPENVYIIGTMNTADQSLTHIDAALKRRFSSIEIMPDSSILKNGMKGLPELLDKINGKIREKRSRDNQIGHSYFMQDGKPITEIKELQFVFATDIIPLLRDYFYDSDDDLKEVLGEQFIDWDEGSDRNVKEDWQVNIETFRTAIKQAYNVTI